MPGEALEYRFRIPPSVTPPLHSAFPQIPLCLRPHPIIACLPIQDAAKHRRGPVAGVSRTRITIIPPNVPRAAIARPTSSAVGALLAAPTKGRASPASTHWAGGSISRGAPCGSRRPSLDTPWGCSRRRRMASWTSGSVGIVLPNSICERSREPVTHVSGTPVTLDSGPNTYKAGDPIGNHRRPSTNPYDLLKSQ